MLIILPSTLAKFQDEREKIKTVSKIDQKLVRTESHCIQCFPDGMGSDAFSLALSELTFGFREPYQVLGAHFKNLASFGTRLMSIFVVDAQMIQDTEKFKMDLVGGLERTLHGRVKPSMSLVVGIQLGTYYSQVITQCSIRHLYTIPDLPRPEKDALVAVAKRMERRRCNHHTLDYPLSTLECFSSVIDPKNSKMNKNRYVIASQEEEVRRYCRGVKGVPLVYVKRSVMVMEPMADSSVGVREGIEREKLRKGLRANGHAAGVKRKRSEHSDVDVGDMQDSGSHEPEEGKALKKKMRGPKGPNPLSVKKRRISKNCLEKTEEDETAQETHSNGQFQSEREADEPKSSMIDTGSSDEKQNSPTKRKRKRKHKKTSS